MLLIGLSYFILWLLLSVFAVELVKAVLVTAIILIVLGLLTEGVPKRFPWDRQP